MKLSNTLNLNLAWNRLASEKLGLVFLAILVAAGCIFSYKSISFLLPLLTIVVIWLQGGLKNITLRVFPPIILYLLLLIWMGISIFWAPEPARALKTFISSSLTFTFAFLLISCLRNATPEIISKTYRLMQMAGAFLLLFIFIQIVADTFHMGLFKKYKNNSDVMKPTGSILGLTAFVVCAFLWINKNKVLSIFIFLLLSLLIYRTLCQTAFFGVIVATAIFVLSYAMPFWMTRINMVSIYTFLVLSPLLYTYAFPPSTVSKSSYLTWVINKNFYHRFLGWEYYSRKFFENPFLGWGAESARYLPRETVLSRGYDNLIHPHNNSIQVYVELGLLGGILYALFFASLFWLVEKHVKDRLSVAVCNATLVFGFVVCEVTHDVWSNFWLSWMALTLGMILLFLKAREAQLPASADHSQPSPAP